MADTDIPPTWGCTVGDVLALISTVNVHMRTGKTQHGETVREGTIYITEQQVEAWIVQVASRVTARLYRFLSIKPTSLIYASVLASARDVVANGAASYAYAASAPEKATRVDSTSYSQVLWQRYLDELEELVATVAAWVDEHPEDGDGARGRTVTGRFPLPFIRDYMRW